MRDSRMKEMIEKEMRGFKEWLEFVKNRLGEEKFLEIEAYLIDAYDLGIGQANKLRDEERISWFAFEVHMWATTFRSKRFTN